ncbi:hypothetical protein [Nannocystis pusilla]|uniref:hypothetical protein n=1 Tax=Nannocystis pusilla TaxID=889268 RepID=UPI003DA52882
MKILDEFRDAKGFDTWTCLTYGADLAWFEHAILRPLQGQGVRRFMILADQTRLSLDLDASPRLLGGMGRSYLLHGVASRVTFHPKLYLLSGERKARLYVGSGNLTRGGLDRNLEVFERWDANDDVPAPAAFEQARVYLDTLVSAYDGEDPIEREHLDLAFRFNRRGFVRAADAGLLASPPPLLDRLPLGKTPCTILKLVAPFFDSEAVAVAQLADRFAASRFEVIVHPRMTNITSRIVRAIELRGGRVLKVRLDDPDGRDRPVHGKLLYARGRGWSVGLVGSANLSLAAWKGLNHELVSVRVGTDADEVSRLIDALPCEPLNDEDLEFFDRLAERRTQQDRDDEALKPTPKLALRHARWLGTARIFVQLAREADKQPVIEIRGERGIVRGNRLTPAGAGWEVDVPAAIRRGTPCLARVAGDPPGAWAVVQDHSEVRASARAEGREREMLDHLLETPGFDPDGAILLMELLASVQQSRVEQQREADPERAAASGLGSGAPEVRHVSLNDFEQRQPGASGAIANYLIPLPSVRLMNRLLFGDEVHDEGGGEAVEVELTDDDDGSEDFLEQVHQTERQSGAHESPIEAMAKFLRASQQARERYLSTVRGARSDPFLLLDDIMLLAAPLHYMMRGRGISEAEFRTEMVPLLRELVCDAHSPLLKAIKRLNETAREELWTNTPIFLLLMLWVYNACLADDVDRTRFIPRTILNVRFSNSHPVLWLRHIVRLVPPKTLGHLLDVLPSTLPRLRTGIFWLGRLWRERIHEAPLEDFVRRSVADAVALDRVEDQLRQLEPRIRERDSGRLPDHDEQVVALGGARPPGDRMG